MRLDAKHKLPLIIGIGLPTLLVLWVLMFAYVLPKILVKPDYDFIYVTGYNAQYARIHNEKVQLDPYLYEKRSPASSGLDFYLYDVKNEENIPLSFEDVELYRLDASEKSSDGYIVRSQSDSSGDFFFFPFFWASSRGYYLSRDNTWVKQISLRGDYYNFKFLGWVLSKNE